MPFETNIPTTSFVRSSLNCAFAVSKSKSDSNCRVVALEFFTRSWPLLRFLDLRLPAREHQNELRQITQSPPWNWFSNYLKQVHLLLEIYISHRQRSHISLLWQICASPHSSLTAETDKTNIAVLSVRHSLETELELAQHAPPFECQKSWGVTGVLGGCLFHL